MTLDRLDGWIRTYDLFPPDLCADLIDMTSAEQSPDGTFGEDWRRCVAYDVGRMGLRIRREVDAALFDVVGRYRRELDQPVLNFATRVETINVFRYDVAPDKPHHFHTHVDAWNPQSASRLISVIVYLNDVDDGGETAFPITGRMIKPVAGRVVVFPSSVTFPHAGIAPRSNTKHILVAWFHLDGEPGCYLTRPFPSDAIIGG